MAILEFLTFSPSTAFKGSEGQESLKFFASYLKTVEGIESSTLYHGARVEDDSLAQIVVAWKSLEAHKACTSSEEFKAVAPRLGTIIDEAKRAESTLLHGQFSQDFESTIKPILESPAVEIALITAKSDELFEETKAKATDLVESAVRSAKGCHGLVVGAFVEEPNKLFLLIGWDAVESHIEATKSDIFKEKGGVMLATGCHMDVFHVKFTGTSA